MDATSKTQIIVAVIGVVGVIGAALIASGFFTPKPAEPTLSTTCQFNVGARAGQTQYYDPNTPYVRATVIGAPCQDGLGSFGVAIANPK